VAPSGGAEQAEAGKSSSVQYYFLLFGLYVVVDGQMEQCIED